MPEPTARLLMYRSTSTGVRADVTDRNGKFAVAVANGEHSIVPTLAGHSFDPAELFLPESSPISTRASRTGLCIGSRAWPEAGADGMWAT
ncbi:MAG: hypothetical protein R3E12_11320 [Candidatus Eisenbacteria bacterium]